MVLNMAVCTRNHDMVLHVTGAGCLCAHVTGHGAKHGATRNHMVLTGHGAKHGSWC